MKKSTFNSLGSNYNFAFAIKTLFLSEKNNRLKDVLEKKYDGKVFLTYKGREAISLILKSLTLPAGSKVAINGFTCLAVFQAVTSAGYQPILLDTDKNKLNFSAKSLVETIKTDPNIKVVIVQNTFGFESDISEIKKNCQQNKLILIEDLAHNAGLQYKTGEEFGTVGDFVALSFSRDKMIDAISGGAAIFRNQNKLPEIDFANISLWQKIVDRFYPLHTVFIRKIYPTGIGKYYHFALKKMGLIPKSMMAADDKIHRLPNFYAALAEDQLNIAKRDLARRQKIGNLYLASIDKKFLLDENYFQPLTRFPIITHNRKKLLGKFRANNIFLDDIWYDWPIAPKKYADDSVYQMGQCPNAEKLSGEILNLPTHQNISEETAEKIIKIINEER
ncbi:MAG: DegT/DnrJ/EryC1/StrS family aminotransferase [Candidatus Berkelbacteria bacterium]